jgi:hypothetical protein
VHAVGDTGEAEAEVGYKKYSEKGQITPFIMSEVSTSL